MCPEMGFLGGFEEEDVKILSSDPKKALPFVNTRVLSGNFGYMGRSNPWGDLDQMSLVGRYRGRNHVCNIW